MKLTPEEKMQLRAESFRDLDKLVQTSRVLDDKLNNTFLTICNNSKMKFLLQLSAST